MNFDPIIASKLLLEIPTALLAAKKLVSELRDSTKREQIGAELERLQRAVIDYATMHYALAEWKELHDRLQIVERSLERLELEVSTGGDIDWRMLEMLWSSFALNQLGQLQSLSKELKYIGTKIDLTSPIQPSRIVDWPDEFRARSAAIEQEFNRSPRDASALREQIGDMVSLVRDSMVAVDRSLRNLATDLANASRALEGALKGV